MRIRFVAARSQTLIVLSLLTVALASAAHSEEAPRIPWGGDLRSAMRESAEQKKPILMMATSKTCGFCHKMLREAFVDTKIVGLLRGGFIPVMIDAEKQAKLLELYKVEAYPTLVIISPDRKIVGRSVGYRTTEQLHPWLVVYAPPAEE